LIICIVFPFKIWIIIEKIFISFDLDQALSLDPRILKFKQEEKAAREAKKKEKEEAAKRAEEATRKVLLIRLLVRKYIVYKLIYKSCIWC